MLDERYWNRKLEQDMTNGFSFFFLIFNDLIFQIKNVNEISLVSAEDISGSSVTISIIINTLD